MTGVILVVPSSDAWSHPEVVGSTSCPEYHIISNATRPLNARTYDGPTQFDFSMNYSKIMILITKKFITLAPGELNNSVCCGATTMWMSLIMCSVGPR